MQMAALAPGNSRFKPIRQLRSVRVGCAKKASQRPEVIMTYLFFTTVAIFALLFVGMIWTGFLAVPDQSPLDAASVVGPIRNRAWDAAVSRGRNRHHGRS